MSLITAKDWEESLNKYSQVHVLQTAAWGRVKGKFGWYCRYVENQQAGAQILFRRIPLGFSIAYIPKGPIGTDWNTIWPEVDWLCRKERAIFLKVEPDSWEDGSETAEKWVEGLVGNRTTFQPRRTIIVDLRGEPETWLERMKQKHRYNIRLALKKDVVVQASEDIGVFHQMMQITGQRDTFGVHTQAYYQRVYDQFSVDEQCVLLLASFQGAPLAGVLVLRQGERAWYFYGASNNLERQRMPAYLLQFEAMKWAKEHGCLEYDLWGVPDEDEETLEREFDSRNDGLWGVYRFKRGFGGQLKRSTAAMEKVYLPGLFRIYGMIQARRGGWHA